MLSDSHPGILSVMSRISAFTLLITSEAMIAAAEPVGPEIPEDVREAIRFRVENGYNASIVAGVLTPEGRAYYAYGHTELPDGSPPDEHSIYEIGSVTKTFTCLLLAILVEEGIVNLDDPIGKFLPLEMQEAPAVKAKVTLEHLATHSAGFLHMPINANPADPYNTYADYTEYLMYDFLQSYELSRDPGSSVSYSNYGMGLLGHLLERATNESYADLVRSRITQPLRMDDTWMNIPAHIEPRVTQNHNGKTPVPPIQWATLYGAGMLRSSAADLLTFAAAHLRIVESSIPSRAIRNVLTPRFGTQALGWGVGSTIGHSGANWGCYVSLLFSPNERKAAVVLSNSMFTLDDLAGHLLHADNPLTDLPVPHKVPIHVLREYEGKYRLPIGPIYERGLMGRNVFVRVLNGQLTIQISKKMAPNVYFAKSESEFFSGMLGEWTAAFERTPDGAVAAVQLSLGGVPLRATRIN